MLIVVPVLASLPARIAAAAGTTTYTWDGGGTDNDWATAANWNTTVATGNNSILAFAGSTRTSNVNNFTAGSTFNSILFNTGAAAFSLSGNSINLNTSLGIVNNSTTLQTINLSSINFQNAASVITAETGDLLIGSSLSGAATSLNIDAGNAARRVTLSGSNSFAGTTTVLLGILRVENSFALGSTAGGTIIGDNEVLELAGDINVQGESLSLRGDGPGTGALLNVSGNNTWSGPISLTGGATTIGSTAGLLTISGSISTDSRALITTGAGDIDISGVIALNVASVTKNGAGNLTLSAANTYATTTTVNAGALTLANGSGLGTAAAGTVVASGAALQLRGNITVGAEALSIEGTGISNGGALRNVSGTNTYGGIVTLTAAATIEADANSELRLSNNVTGNFAKTFDAIGSIVASGTVIGSGGVTKTGAGLLTLSAANTFTGALAVNAGTVRATSNASALGGATATLTLGGGNLELAADSGLNFGRATTVSTSGTIFSERLTAGAGVTHTLGTLSIGAQTLTVATDASVTSGTAGLTFGNVTQSGASTFDVASGVSLTLGALQSAQGLTKQGAGTVFINSAANTARTSGVNTVSAGTMQLGSASALGTTGATLTLNGGAINLATDTTVNAYNTTVGGNATVVSNRSTAGAGVTHTLGTLSIGGQTLSIEAGANATSGTAAVQFGAVTFSGAPTFAPGANARLELGALGDGGTGRTIVKGGAGILTLSSSATSLSANTAFDVNAGTLQVTNAFATGTNAAVDVADGATFSLGASQTIAALTNAGSTLNNGSVGIGNGFTLTVNNASANTFSGVVSGAGGLTKANAGTLTLSGSNTFVGTLAINSGVVRATTNAQALGAGAVTLGGGNLELANDTGLNFGRNLTVASSGTLFSERLTAGAGVTHTLGGLAIGSQTLALATDATVTSGTAAVAFSAGVTLSGNPTFNTAAGTEFVFLSGFDGGFNVTKTGLGTLTIVGGGNQANTTVSAGRLNVNSLQALGTVTGTLSLAAGTTLGNTSGNDVTVGNAKAIALGSSLNFAGPSNLNLGPGVATLSAANTTIDVAQGTLTFGGNVVGNGLGITKTGSGTLVFTHLAPGGYTGNTTISQGELFLDGLSVFGGGTATVVTVQPGAFLRIGSSASVGNVTIDTWTGGLITGTVTAANVTYTTSGTLTPSDGFIDGTQTVDSNVTVSATANYFGTIPATAVADRIVIRNNGKLRTAASLNIEPTQGVLLSSGTATFEINGSGGQRLFVESAISGSGALRKTGVNNLRLLGENTYTGGTIIEEGIIGIVADSSLGAVSGGVQIVGGELVGAQTAAGGATDVTIATARSITIGNATTSAISAQTGNTLAYAGTISEINGGGAAGNLRVGLSGPRTGTVVLSGANTYRGSTTVAAGTLEVAVLANGGSSSGIGQSSNAAANLVLEGGSKLRFIGANAATDRLFTLGAGGATLDSGSGTLAFTNSGVAALAGTGARTFTLAGSGSGRLATVLTDLDPANKTSLTKTGAGTWELTSAQQFTGPTAVQGGTLLVNGSLGSDVLTSANTTLGGAGLIAGTVSGAGLVSPGNSPGIMTAEVFDPAGGLDTAFEFTAFNPVYSQSGAGALNDVLRLTDDSAPFAAPLTATNIVNVYFNVTQIDGWDTFTGGFFTDKDADFLASVSNATYNFYVRGNGSGTATTFNGQGYYDLSSWGAANITDYRGVTRTTTQVASANFASGTVTNGWVTQFVVVPEPSTIIGVAGAGAIVVFGRIFRRRKTVRIVSDACAALLVCWTAVSSVAHAGRIPTNSDTQGSAADQSAITSTLPDQAAAP